MPRPPGFNKLQQDQFIEEYIKNGGVKSRAAEATGCSYSAVMKWFKEDEDFCERVKDAEEVWYDSIRGASMKKAIQGKSDFLAMKFLEARYPEIYDPYIRKRRFMEEIVNELGSRLPMIHATIIEKGSSEYNGNTNGNGNPPILVDSGSDK